MQCRKHVLFFSFILIYITRLSCAELCHLYPTGSFPGMSQALTFLCAQVTSTTTTVTAKIRTTTSLETRSMTSHVCPLKTSLTSSPSWHAKIECSESCRQTELSFTVLIMSCSLSNERCQLFYGFVCRDLNLHMTQKFLDLLLCWNCIKSKAS